MTSDYYVRLNRRIRSDKTSRQLVLLLNEMLTWVIMIIYLASLVRIYVTAGIRMLLITALVPLVTFIISRLLRRVIREPRPYRSARIRPLVRKKSTSYSFPSCHITSAFVIGTCLCTCSYTVTGIIVLVLGCVLAFVRVLSGAHYIRDVLAGAALGVLGGLIPFLII